MAGRESERAWHPWDGQSGPPGYREPEEPPDGRPVLVRGKFWASASEQLQYEYTVHAHPRQGGEGVMGYIARIAEIVAKHPLPAPAKDMPRLPYKDSPDEEDKT